MFCNLSFAGQYNIKFDRLVAENFQHVNYKDNLTGYKGIKLPCTTYTQYIAICNVLTF